MFSVHTSKRTGWVAVMFNECNNIFFVQLVSSVFLRLLIRLTFLIPFLDFQAFTAHCSCPLQKCGRGTVFFFVSVADTLCPSFVFGGMI